jgi:coiled-coil domain-containing protein 63/114
MAEEPSEIVTQQRQEDYQDTLRRYRQVEHDMKVFADEMSSIYRKQEQQVAKLEQENKKHAEDLNLQELQLNKQQKIQTASQKSMKGQEEELKAAKEKLEKETQLNKRLDESLQIVQKEIIESKRKQSGTGGIISGQERSNQLSRQVKIIENRLDKANQKYSDAVTKNKVMREQIDSLRRERVMFEQMYAKLEKDLGVKRTDMARLIDEVG